MDSDQRQGGDQESLAVFCRCKPATGDTKYSDKTSTVRDRHEGTDNSYQNAHEFDDFIYTHLLSPCACFYDFFFKLLIIIAVREPRTRRV